MFYWTLYQNTHVKLILQSFYAHSKHASTGTNGDPQDGGSVCCCYEYHVEMRLQNCVVRCVLRIFWCVMSNACHWEQEYTQDGGHGKMADSLYWCHCQLKIVQTVVEFCSLYTWLHGRTQVSILWLAKQMMLRALSNLPVVWNFCSCIDLRNLCCEISECIA